MECDVNQLKSYIVSTLASLSIDTGIPYLEDLAVMIKQHPFKTCSELVMGLIEGYVIVKIRQYLDNIDKVDPNNVVVHVSSLVGMLNIAITMCTSRECIESLMETVYRIICGCGENI